MGRGIRILPYPSYSLCDTRGRAEARPPAIGVWLQRRRVGEQPPVGLLRGVVGRLLRLALRRDGDLLVLVHGVDLRLGLPEDDAVLLVADQADPALDRLLRVDGEHACSCLDDVVLVCCGDVWLVV